MSNSCSLPGWNVYLVINYTGCLNHTRHRIALSVCAMCVLALRLCLCFRGRAKFQGLIRTKPDLPSRLTSVSLANRAENVLISPATQLRLDQISCEIHENLNKPGDFFFWSSSSSLDFVRCWKRFNRERQPLPLCLTGAHTRSTCDTYATN